MRNNGFSKDQSILEHLKRFIGETVTIFTTSGGVSGCGFTGMLLDVNCEFVRLLTEEGFAPTDPISKSCCDRECEDDYERSTEEDCEKRRRSPSRVGSICDIPIDKIASFCHNAV